MTVREWFRKARGSMWERELPAMSLYVLDDTREKGFYVLHLSTFGDYYSAKPHGTVCPRAWAECVSEIENAIAVADWVDRHKAYWGGLAQ